MASWYRVRERATAEGIYYVQAESPSDAKRRIREGSDYWPWSGTEIVPGTQRVIGRAEKVGELPEFPNGRLMR